MKYAILSVSDKTGIVEFARGLIQQNYEIVSTGGTAKKLKEEKIPVRNIDDLTGFPEIMDGRVKTLHPKVHGGLLAVRENADHVKQMEKNGIYPIDLVAVNLYPFENTIAKETATLEDAIENIDIGGPTMLRSSAKNHRYVTVVVDPSDYPVVLREMEANGGSTSLETRQKLAVKVFSHTADYDSCIDIYLSRHLSREEKIRFKYGKGRTLRYGENSHQKSTFYESLPIAETCVPMAEQLHGKEISYNNLVDAEAAFEAVKEFADVPAVTVIKHTNPCGFATGETLVEALEAAWQGDPVSAYGSIIAVTQKVDLKTSERLKGRYIEILIAPDYDDDALEFLKKKSKDIRLLKTGPIGKPVYKKSYKFLTGGLLEQDRDLMDIDKWETVTKTEFSESKKGLAKFAWIACKHTKSNAIVFAREYKAGCYQVIGMGAGQPNRIDSTRKLAATKSISNLELFYQSGNDSGSFEEYREKEFNEFVMASDAFFPFPDNIEVANELGIRYVVQPGGAKRDMEVIETCDRFGIAMIFTGMRHFKH